MTGSHGQAQPVIDKRDFDTNRRPSESEAQEDQGLLHSRPESSFSASIRYTDNEDGLLNDVVDEIVERDRRKIAREVIRVCSFVWGIVTW